MRPPSNLPAGDRSNHEPLPAPGPAKSLSGRMFGVSLGSGLTIAGCAPLLRHGHVRQWALVPAIALFFLAIMAPGLLGPLAQVWARIAGFVNRILTFVLMGLLFYLVFTPIGLVRRLCLRDPFRLRMRPDVASYWIAREPPGPRPDSMADQF